MLARSNLDTVPRIRPKRWHIIINNDKCIPCGSTKTKYKIGVFVDFVSLYRTLWGTNQKIKIHFFVFSTLSGPSETKKTWKFVWQIGETKLRQISPKKKNSNFVFCALSPTRNGLTGLVFVSGSLVRFLPRRQFFYVFSTSFCRDANTLTNSLRCS